MHKKNFQITGQPVIVKDEMLFFAKKKKVNTKKYRFDNDSIDNDTDDINDNGDFSYNDENEDHNEFGGKTKYQSVWKSGNMPNNNLRFI